MLTDHTIYPISGFGELEFYMSPHDVSTLLGPPPDSEKEANNTFFTWHYPKLGVLLLFEKETYYTLSMIYFEKTSRAIFIETPLFSHTPESLTTLINDVGHIIIEDDPNDDYPIILVSPSLTMTFYFTASKQLDAVAFEAPPAIT